MDYRMGSLINDLLKEFVALSRGTSVVTIERDSRGTIQSIGVTQNYK